MTKAAMTTGVLSGLAVATMADATVADAPASATDHAQTIARTGAPTTAPALARVTTDRVPGRASRTAARPPTGAVRAAVTAVPRRSATTPAPQKPVAGLTQTQMNNARRIVEAGRSLRLPRRAYVIAVACAMQESMLRNLASDVIPESFRYPHEGSGSDHDSVGLFQQRPSAGWGTVGNLMTPAYAARQFYLALRRVSGWERMPLTYAAQAVQVSAFPEAYAKHEWAAQKVVDALI